MTTEPEHVSGSDEDPLGIVGTTIADKYQIERFVAEGGFSLLYRAQHKIWKQPVAVKFLKILSSAPPGQRQHLLDSFLQEGQLLRSLSSRTASILQAHDVGTYETPQGDWFPYLILEWLDGSPLDGLLEREKAQGSPPWTLDEVVRLLEPASKALEVVHRKGIAHRDIKPANIFVIGHARSDDAFVKVLDFGIAKVIGDMAELSAAKAQTGTGVSSFTPWYGAPEQFSKRYGATGPWTDVFALALIIVEMLTQRPPLEGDELPQLALESTNPDHRPTPRAKGVAVPDAVEAVFSRAFAVKTTERYATAGQFWNALCEAMGSSGRMIDMGAPSLSAPSLVNPAIASTLSPAEAARLSSAPTVLPSTGSPFPTGNIPAVGRTTLSPTEASAPRSKAPLALGAAALVALLAGGGLLLSRSKPEGPSQLAPSAAPPASSPASSAAAPPPAPSCPSGMVMIPGGDFYMGYDGNGATPLEKPQHQVTVSPFCIDVTEVTVEAYRACSLEGHCPRAASEVDWPGISARERKIYSPLCNADRPGKDKHPINCVDWEKADNFCQKMGKRLPTSAEWEFAVRGPDGRVYPWGDEKPDANHLNACGKECMKWAKEHGETLQPMHDEDDGFPTTAPVGSFPKGRSRYGLDDVIGNVMEWVHDWDGPYTKDAQVDPKGPDKGDERVIRGGAWNAGSSGWVRPSFRFKFDPQARSHGIGFRCAKPLK